MLYSFTSSFAFLGGYLLKKGERENKLTSKHQIYSFCEMVFGSEPWDYSNVKYVLWFKKC